MEKTRLAGNKTVQFIKLAVLILVFPLLVGFCRGLIAQTFALEDLFWKSLYWGVASYLLFHIFLIEPVKFYKKTQSSIQIVFGFFMPLLRVAYYIVPFWVLVLIGVYLVVYKVLKVEDIRFLFFFLSGFLFAMHLVMVAKLLKTDKPGKLIDYLFILFAVLIINIFFFAANCKLYEPEFSVSQVGREGIETGVHLARSIYDQLFVPGS
ncbi:hypothetical protein ACFL5X_03795 [Candidatus Omnitrophota bacterium]